MRVDLLRLKMANFRGVICIDIDDTLFDSTGFRKVSWQMQAEAIGSELNKLEVEINAENIFELMQIAYERSGKNPNLMIPMTLEVISQKFGREFSSKETSQLISAAQSALEMSLDKYMVLFPNSLNSIRTLISNGFLLLIASAGEKKFQLKKIEKLGLGNYFPKEYTFITDKKDKKFYEKLRSKFPNLDMYMIGDKMDQDIVPALEAEFDEVFLVGSNYDKKLATKYSGEYKKLNSFADIIGYFYKKIA